jgi:hypothetical protein
MLMIDMTMPECCMKCPMVAGYGCGYMGVAMATKDMKSGRHPDCPLKELVQCVDCDWWTKQEASLQGHCQVHGMYPTEAYYCGTGRRRTEDVD